MREVNKIGIIGVGRWGTNYLRTFNELENCSVKWICAAHESSIKSTINNIKIRNRLKTTTDYREILEDEEVDAVAIVSDGSTHYSFAKEALNTNKHVIVEKPMAFSSRCAKDLIKLSEKRGKILMVGHLHRFNPGIQKLKADIDKGIFGKINFICLSHFGNGPIRRDMSALWDFFPHSISILFHLLGEAPLSVNANGAFYTKEGIEDVVTMNISYPNKIFATSIASWLYPLKKMDITVVGEKLYATFDDYATEEKLKYYYTRPNIINDRVIINDEGYMTPKIIDTKPLTMQLEHFLDCIENNKKPLTDGYEGLKVVSVLEAAQKSLKNNGKMINVRIEV